MTILEVQDVPPSPNVVKRKYRNPHAYRRLRTSWETMLLYSISPHHRTALKAQAKVPGKVFVDCTLHHSRAYDPDNLFGSTKVILDALVNIGFLADDSPANIRLTVQQVKAKRKEVKTVVKIGAVD